MGRIAALQRRRCSSSTGDFDFGRLGWFRNRNDVVISPLCFVGGYARLVDSE